MLKHRQLALQAEVFEEVATMDLPFEGIPTIPPRKDTAHLAFFCGGCRYRVTAAPSDTVAKVRALNIVHRDLKPENMFKCEDNTVKLIDFGSA